MESKMRKYLLSLGLTDIERFDMDFVSLARNPSNPNQLDIVIHKDTAWDYLLFLEFSDAVAHQHYPCDITFVYGEKITSAQTLSLLQDWYLNNYHGVLPFEVELSEEALCLLYPSPAERTRSERVANEFREFLRWIDYPIRIEEVTLEPAPVVAPEPKETIPEAIEEESMEPAPLENAPGEPIVEEKVEEEKPQVEFQPLSETMPPVVDEPPAAEEETILEDVPPLSDEEIDALASTEETAAPAEQPAADEEDEIAAKIQKDLEDFQKLGEEELYLKLVANQKAMLEEKERKRLYKVGNYEFPENIADIDRMGLVNVDFCGEVFGKEIRPTKKGYMMIMSVGDQSDAISVRAFDGKRIPKELMDRIKDGTNIRVRGAIGFDKISKTKSIQAHFLDLMPPKAPREDTEEEKRVELHLHTNMSTMDGIPDFSDYYELARSMGMKAIAVTDHGAVQSFPAAQGARDKHKKKLKGKDTSEKPLKIIYGCEVYMFDMQQTYIQNPCDAILKDATYCVFDTETTGLSSQNDRIIEFGCVIVENGRIVDRFDTFINPQMDLTDSAEAMAINKITEDDLRDAPTIEQAMPKILEKLGNHILVAHNATFDIGFLNAALSRMGMPKIANPVIDTIPLSHYLFPAAGRHTEGAFLRNLGLNIYDDSDAHRANYDAEKLSDGWLEALARLDEEHPKITHRDLASLSVKPGDPEDPDPVHKAKQDGLFSSYCRHLREYHATILVKNQAGLKDLYRIVTESHIHYFARVPKTPRSLIEEKRDNFLIGSACFNGEIFEIASTRNEEDLVKAMAFYDYIEIQPLENYSYLIHMGRVKNQEHLIRILRSIVSAAKKAGKPVVATGDVHYLNPEDRILRDVYIAAKGVGKGAHPMNPPARDRRPYFDNPDQYFRSTNEMLDSFRSWMSEEEAREVVITNSNLIADQIDDDIRPVSDNLYPPNENLPNSDRIIRDLCEGNFDRIYRGNPDPKVQKCIEEIHERLERELNGIINNGYAVTYYIAHLLIREANNEPEHYIVGSRGSVGSSFAATMAEITEVNPLPPHYYCPHCHYFEWGDKAYKSGFDLPAKRCPDCGGKLQQNGQNIPFETFLGFSAEKVPDIDLNFEDESQKKAHDYTKKFLGERNVFRAGTVETVADKTAFGYVKGLFEARFMKLEGLSKEEAEEKVNQMNKNYIAYLAFKCKGVKRTTGRHPGGIVVVPSNMSILDFTPVQFPADDLTSTWLTTHFDFGSMHDEILKFDILGHVDPMAMRYYRDLTGVKIEDIPMNDPRVLSLFTSPKELKLKANYLELQTGALALPEFGTPMAQRMLLAAKPKCFNDLLIISGLAHGTDVWNGNAEELIRTGKADINGVIGCRDDIMTYLIHEGLEPSAAFQIMEDVRHGKGLTESFEAMMREHHVPEYYISSAKKIKYLFPRGHATAYVMMAVRVAYFKLYHPLEFYAVFFSIRSDDWDIAAMVGGEEALIARYEELKEKINDRNQEASPKEKNIYSTLSVAIEMVERGYTFTNIDLYRSDPKMFVVDEANKALIPPFSAIDGIGVSAAQALVDARYETDRNGNQVLDEEGNPKIKPFLSKEDLVKRAPKFGKANLEKLDRMGVTKDLGETNQMSLFDFGLA